MSEADYNKLTIAQLKEELESRSLDKTGRKADLVSRLLEHDKASGTEAVEEEEEEEEAAMEETTEQSEDMVTLDQVGDGEDAAQPDAATEEALLKEDEPPAEGAAAEAGDAADAEAPADTSATESKDAEMKDMVVIDEFDALGDEIEVEMARLIDEQIEAARERTKLEEAEKEKKAKEEAEKKAAKEAEEAIKKEAKENGEESTEGEVKKEGDEDDTEKKDEEKPEEEKTEEEKKADQEKKEKEEKEKKEKEENEKKEKERKKHVPRMTYARPPKMADAKLELACDMVKHTVQVQPLSLEQLNHPAIQPFLDQATTYRFMRGWNSERGLTGRLHLIFRDPAKIDEVIKAVEDNQEELGEQCKARSFGGIKTVDIRHTFMRQVVPCTDADIGQLSLLLRRMPVGITSERLREVFPDSTYILLNKEERYSLVLYQDKEKFEAVLEKAEELEIDDAKIDCSQYQPFKKPKPEQKEEEEPSGDDIRKNAIRNLYRKYCEMEKEGSDMAGLAQKIAALKKMLEADDALKKKEKKKDKKQGGGGDRKQQGQRRGGFGRGGNRGGNRGGGGYGGGGYGQQGGMKRRRNDNYGPQSKQGRFDDRGAGRFYGGGGSGYGMGGGGGYDQGGYGGGGYGQGYGNRMGGAQGYGGGSYGNQGSMGGGSGGGQGNALNFIVGLSQALNNMKQGGRSGGGGGGYGGGGYGGGGYGGGSGGGYGGRQFGGRNRRN